MTLLVISILRIGGLVVCGLGVILTLLSLPVAMEMMRYGGGNAMVALLPLVSAIYPIFIGAALYGLAEIISLLRQIRDRAQA